MFDSLQKGTVSVIPPTKSRLDIFKPTNREQSPAILGPGNKQGNTFLFAANPQHPPSTTFPFSPSRGRAAFARQDSRSPNTTFVVLKEPAGASFALYMSRRCDASALPFYQAGSPNVPSSRPNGLQPSRSSPLNVGAIASVSIGNWKGNAYS